MAASSSGDGGVSVVPACSAHGRTMASVSASHSGSSGGRARSAATEARTRSVWRAVMASYLLAK